MSLYPMTPTRRAVVLAAVLLAPVAALAATGASASSGPAGAAVVAPVVAAAPAPAQAAATTTISPFGVAHVVADRLPDFGITAKPTLFITSRSEVPGIGSLARLEVAGPKGRGMLQVMVDRSSSPVDTGMFGDLGVSMDTTDSNGVQTVVLENDSNCIQSQTVIVYNPATKTVVTVNNATCRSWNGTTNPSSKRLLSTKRAIDLAKSPGLTYDVPPSVNEAGERQFPRPRLTN